MHTPRHEVRGREAICATQGRKPQSEVDPLSASYALPPEDAAIFLQDCFVKHRLSLSVQPRSRRAPENHRNERLRHLRVEQMMRYFSTASGLNRENDTIEDAIEVEVYPSPFSPIGG